MSKKHYELIAAALRRGIAAGASAEDLVYWIADALSLDNHRFDQDRFLRAALGDKNA